MCGPSRQESLKSVFAGVTLAEEPLHSCLRTEAEGASTPGSGLIQAAKCLTPVRSRRSSCQPRTTDVPTAKRPADVLPAALDQQTQQLLPNHALAGRAGLQDGSRENYPGWAEWGKVWHPIDLPEGYHTPVRGQSRQCARQFHRGLPPSWRAIGLRQVDRTPP